MNLDPAEVLVLGIQQVIVLGLDDCAGHFEDGRRSADNPLVSDSLKLFRCRKASPVLRKAGSIGDFHQTFRDSATDENPGSQSRGGPEVYEDLESGKSRALGGVHDPVTGRVPAAPQKARSFAVKSLGGVCVFYDAPGVDHAIRNRHPAAIGRSGS